MIADLDLLLTFKAIVAYGSFKNAAERLNKTQSAISMQMKRLEEHVGQRLLTRNSQGLKLTATGSVVLRYAEHLHALQRKLTDEIRGFDLQGEVRFGVPVDFVSDALARILPFLKQEFPGIRLSVQCAFSRDLRRMIDKNDIDLAIITCEEDIPEGVPLWQETLAWFGAAGAGLDREAEVPVALFEGDCLLRDMMLADLREMGVSYKVALTSPHVRSLVTAAETGFAVSLLPTRECDAGKCEMLFGGYGLRRRQWDIALIGTDAFRAGPMNAVIPVVRDLFAG